MNKSSKKVVSHSISSDVSNITTYNAGIVQSASHRKLQKICDDALRPFGITKIHWLIIGTVYDHRATGIRISDLARAVGTNLPYMTNTVNLLETKKILERYENQMDNRSNFVAVHPSFLPKCRKIEEMLRIVLREKIYADISPEDFATYMRVLYRLSDV